MITHLLATSLIVPSGPYIAWLDTVKSHIRQISSDDDGLLKIYLGAAVRFIERSSDLILLNRAEELSLDCFPCDGMIRIRKKPLTSVDAVRYTDSNGNVVTMDAADYQSSNDGVTTRIRPAPGKTWPVIQSERLGAVTVAYTAGFGTTLDDVPEDVRNAILLLVGHWEQNREAAVVGTITSVLKIAVDELLEPYRAPSFA